MKHPIDIPSIEEFRHAMPVQLRFNDIDILGHVNNTVYFSLYDLGKARWMGEIVDNKINWQRVETIIANIDCAFISQMRFGEDIYVLTRCVHIGRKSFTLQQMLVNTLTREVKSVAETVMVCIDPDKMKSVEINPEYRRLIETYEIVKPQQDPLKK